MSPHLHYEHSARITERLRDRLNIQRLKCVAGYVADDGEIDLANTFKWFHKNAIPVAIPYLRDGAMKFGRFQPDQIFVRGEFGIWEPELIETVQLTVIDLMLVPLVAFSSEGDRLGRGGGHYDRTLNTKARPFTVGIAHEFQLSDEFSTVETDVSLDAVVTERRWRQFNSGTNPVLRGI